MQRPQVRHLRALRVLHVLEQAAGRADGGGRVLGVEPAQVLRAELRAQQPLGRAGVEVPGRAVPQPGVPASQARRVRVFGDQQLGRLQALELRVQRVDVVELRDAEAPAREVEPRERRSAA